MCVVSFVGDHFNGKFEPYKDYINRTTIWDFSNHVSRKEFEELKKQVQEMIELMKKAKIYDEKNNEPDCELENKMAFLRKAAELVGLNLDDVIKPKL